MKVFAGMTLEEIREWQAQHPEYGCTQSERPRPRLPTGAGMVTRQLSARARLPVCPQGGALTACLPVRRDAIPGQFFRDLLRR